MDNTITTLEFCAGYGGIGLGLKNIFSERLRCLAYCELEGFAQANLISKMEKGLLDVAPLWNDLKTFPYGKFHGLVDILIAGYPCQPFSAAGKRAGKEDPRHLWPWIADGIRILRPRVCFFENVEGHISLGLSSVISDLEELGYQVSWGIFSASEVGAPHQRKRVFILAHDAHGEQRAWSLLRQNWQGATLLERCGSGRAEELADSCGNGHDGWPIQDGVCGRGVPQLPQPLQGECAAVRSEVERCCDMWPSRPGEPQYAWEPPRVVGSVPKKLADFCSRHSQSWGDTAQAGGESTCERREGADAMPHGGSSLCGGDQGDKPEVVGNSEQFLFPAAGEHGAMDEESGIPADGERSKPSQADPITGSSRKREGNGSNASKCSETQPSLGGNPDGPADWLDYAELYTTCDNRTDELRLLGNGVVPATAERAFRTLLTELLTNKQP